MTTPLARIAEYLAPGGWTCDGDDYATLTPAGQQTKPTLAELEAVRAEAEAAIAAHDLQREKLGALPGALLAEFAKLSPTHQARWYANGVRSGLKEAFEDRNYTVARAIVANASVESPDESANKAAMLQLFTDAGIE